METIAPERTEGTEQDIRNDAVATTACPTCDGAGTVPTFAALRERLGWTVAEAAEHLCVHPRTITRWDKGEHKVGKFVLEKMESLVKGKK